MVPYIYIFRLWKDVLYANVFYPYNLRDILVINYDAETFMYVPIISGTLD